MEKIDIGIIGAAGYTAGELLRILVHHPHVRTIQAQSESQAGQEIAETHTDLVGDFSDRYVKELNPESCDVVFLCKGHGKSREFLERNPEFLRTRIVDLSQDYRLTDSAGDFVYGLPEINATSIKDATHIANPGCFATAIQLALLPAVKYGSVDGDIHVSGLTGSTGAGQSFTRTSHYSWRMGNASVYKVLQHQHMHEVGESVKAAGGIEGDIYFVPYRGAFTRGIITTAHFTTRMTEAALKDAYATFYADASFTHVTDANPDLKMVVNTNKGIVQVTRVGDQAVVISVIDNLLKGASGQAVQNMNLMSGFDEAAGLHLKSTGF